MWKVSRIVAVCFALLGTVGFISHAEAAEFTDLLDAADDKDDYDEDTYDPFDFNLEPSFTYNTGRAKITREAPCVPASDAQDYANKFGVGKNDEQLVENNPRVQFDPGRCDEVGVVENKEMLYRHQEARLDITLRVGMYKDLELRINAPIVFNSRHGLKYANEDPRADKKVSEDNSSVDPSDSSIKNNAESVFDPSGDRQSHLARMNRFKQHRFFDLTGEFRDIERAGFADPSIGVHWAPFNDQRDDTKATLTLGMDYVLPIAPIRQQENDAVGEGLHKLRWNFGSSKQFDWIDPYFGLEYTLQLPARGSPIKELKEIDKQNDGQSVTQPPQIGRIAIGTEFVPHEDKELHRRYAIDLGFTFGYTSEGRDYSPLYEHMVNSQCNGKSTNDIVPKFDGSGNLTNPGGVGCSWIAQRPGNVRPEPKYDLTSLNDNDEFFTNGIMTVESYATFAGHLGFYLQPSEYFQFKALVGLTHKQEHFLTNARTGNDIDDSKEADADSKVDLTGEDSKLEKNPAYNSTYDSPGTRFRVNEFNTWSFLVTAALQF